MSLVDKRVLIRLSPSEPPGRVSILTVMPGLAFSKAAITAFPLATEASSFGERNVIVVPLPLPLLLPRLPALQPVNAAAPTRRAASGATRSRFDLDDMGTSGGMTGTVLRGAQSQGVMKRFNCWP